MHKSLYIILFLFAASGAQAQQLPERSLVRKGNRQYNKGNYEQSAAACCMVCSARSNRSAL